MLFKTPSPVLTESDENLEKILEYVSEIRTECEVRLTYIEQILENIKSRLESLSSNVQISSASEVNT